MPIDPDAAGRQGEPRETSWTSKDAILYALGVGAGAADPLEELDLTTENTAGVEQRVLPTFAVVVGVGHRPDVGTYDRAKLVHAEQAIELHRPIPVEGSVTSTTRVTGVYDKGKGALVVFETSSVDTDGRPMFTNRSSVYIRGEGGFGGERGPSGGTGEPPDRAPDHVVVYPTRPDQALLYRLSGDRNPLHSDPGFARRGGFERPILHGLCTYGFTARALLHALCQGDPARFRSMQGRFSRPVLPGETLTVKIWSGADGAIFRTENEGGEVVLDRGRWKGT